MLHRLLVRVLLVVAAGAVIPPGIPAGLCAAPPEHAAFDDWAVDPTIPGDNLPPAGRSLFDFVVARKRGDRVVHEVPFPFTALVDRIAHELYRGSAGAMGIKAVLIPQGRSLQRAAGEPRPYAYPRVVLVPDAEPIARRGESGMLLKDRLYLGYHEKAAVVEVISYNEAAGRFEFQVVKDYRQGGERRVYYANRAMCTACHQNAAPIFSRQLWDETNANPAIAARLLGEKREHYGVAPDRGVDVPYAIDNATDRANVFSAYQRLWQAGCAAGESNEQVIRCRAGLLLAALQYRLSGKQQYDRASSYHGAIAAALRRSARTLWPEGLRIANADLPNRNPRDSAQAGDDGPAEVRPAFDPLTARLPLEVWPVGQPATADRLVAGLAEFIAEADARSLDAHLRSHASSAARITLTSACTVARGGGSGRERIDFECAPAAQDAEGPVTRGRFYVSGSRVEEGTLERLAFRGSPDYTLHDVDITAGRVTRGNRAATAELRFARGAMSVRSAEGRAIVAARLAWNASSGNAPAAGQLHLMVIDDFAPVRAAIESMATDALAGRGDAFTGRPFRRVALLRPLFEALNMPRIAWCCEETTAVPAAVMETEASSTIAHAPELEPFYRYCATCHQSLDRSPPNFLHGPPQDVAVKLAHCAPRLRVRLSMWQQAPEQRAKTPMPPQYALYGFHVTPDTWRDGRDLAAMRHYVEQLLKAETGRVTPVATVADERYEKLRECLP